MQRFLKFTFSLLLAYACSTQVSCQRQTLELPEYILAYIPITIDWSESAVPESDIVNVSAYFYPDDGSDPIIAISSDKDYILAQLPIGSYDAVIYNEVENNIAGITHHKGTSAKTYYVGSINESETNLSGMYYDTQEYEYAIMEPDAMGSWNPSIPIEITTETITYTRSSEFAAYIASVKASAGTSSRASMPALSSTLSSSAIETIEELQVIYPQPLTTTFDITLKVINLSNVQSMEAILRGTTNKVNVYTRDGVTLSYGDEPIHYIKFLSGSYIDSDQVDGYMYNDFLSFGVQPLTSNTTYELYFTAIIATGEAITATRDVTSQINEHYGSKTIIIDLTSDEDMLVLPEGIADGFGMEDWGEFENVDIH